MKKYKVLVRGENFHLDLDGEDQRLGFYTTLFLEGEDEEEAKEMAIALLRDDREFRRSVLNEKTRFADDVC